MAKAMVIYPLSAMHAKINDVDLPQDPLLGSPISFLDSLERFESAAQTVVRVEQAVSFASAAFREGRGAGRRS
jgi:hypothetical protein